MATARRAPALADTIQEHLTHLAAGKKGYDDANRVLNEELVDRMKVGQPILMKGGKTVALLVDKFAETHRVGAGLGVNRYEIVIRPK